MLEMIEEMVERIDFSKKEKFGNLVKKCVELSKGSDNEEHLKYPNVVFKMEKFFKSFPDFINEFGKDRKYQAGVEALYVVATSLGIEIEKEECFIIFHIRDLGKFRLSESKLKPELESLWKKYPEYKLEDRDFSYALKNLMRMKFINYRKGNIHLNPSILIRYRQR